MTAPRYLSAAEVRKLLAVPYDTPSGRRDGLFLRLLLGSGLRRAEAMMLCPNDFNLVDGTLLVRHGKGDKLRVVPIDRNLIRDLLAFAEYEHIPRDGRLWPYDISWASKLVSLYARRAGLHDDSTPRELRVHTHTLRHTFAMQSLAAGRNLATVQHDMGHSNVQTTSKYLNITIHDRQVEHLAKPLPWEKTMGEK